MIDRQFKSVKKDRLFYDRFEYCIGFYLDEVSCLRVLDHAHIDDFISRRKQWQEIAQNRWLNHNQKYGIILGRRWQPITEKTVEDLHVLTDVLLKSSSEFKLVVSVHQGYVYTNDLALIQKLDNMPELSYKTYAQAQISRPKNTIKLKNPRYLFRSYLKSMHLTALQKEHLVDFLCNQQDHVRVSPALQQWADHPFTRTQDYFFVDHNTENWLTLLSLVQPGIVRKTMHIIPDK